MTSGPDGNLWFVESQEDKIARITPDRHHHRVPAPRRRARQSGSPAPVVFGPDGNIWFGEMNAQKIGRMTPQGVLTEFPLQPQRAGAPYFLAVGADGNIWGTDSSYSQILRITP